MLLTIAQVMNFRLECLQVKAGMVRVWVAGKTVLLSRAISERFRDKFMIMPYTNRCYFTLLCTN